MNPAQIDFGIAQARRYAQSVAQLDFNADNSGHGTLLRRAFDRFWDQFRNSNAAFLAIGFAYMKEYKRIKAERYARLE